ncbi:hypothetical protein [Brucella gallinifaecis]|uniref:COG3904 family protein n=1 Tax=Brucella gallinifaecis TaxID=215590 RepID=UPI0023620553|nr:hypothetical protein [Brucella gallinifaecis]
MIKQLLPVFVLTALTTTTAYAIDIKTIRYNHSTIFVVDGVIEVGDADKFKKAWEEEAYDAFSYSVALNSPGGILGEGIKLGEFFRKQNVKTIVAKYSPKPPLQEEWEYSAYAQSLPGAECNSACALAFMGGVERIVEEDAKIGFHQFYGSYDQDNQISHSELETSTQSASAQISNYLRRMGAKQELFEVMSITPPNDMYFLSRSQLTEFGVTPSDKFSNFVLKAKSGEIVASAVNPLNARGLEKLYEMEFFCWKGKPTINFYAEKADGGLSVEQISFLDRGWRVFNDKNEYEFENSTVRFYPNQRIMATLILDKKIAKEMIKGSFSTMVNSMTANGFFLGGHIDAPNGDQSIQASLKDCL